MTTAGTAPTTARGVSAAAAVHAALVALVASAAVGVWAAAEPGSAAAALRQTLFAGAGYALVWAAARYAGRGNDAAAGLVLAGVGAAAFFLTQYQYLALDAKVAWLDALARAISRPFAQNEAWAPFPNSLATFLDGIAGAALGLTLGSGRRAGRGLAAVALGVIALAVLASASRGSWLAVGAAVAAGLWAARRLPAPPAWITGSAVAVGVLAVIAGAMAQSPPWWIRLAALAGRPDRLEVYQHAVTLLRDVPYTGIGAGDQFAAHLSRYALLIQVPYLTYSHNLPLEIWLEHGLAGLAAWWALAVATLVGAAAAERAGCGWRTRGLWVGLLAVHLHGLSDARPSIDAWTAAPFFVLTALLAARLGRRAVRVSPAAAAAPLAMAVLVIATVVVARGPGRAPWLANLAAVAQARADLGSSEADAGDRWRAEAVTRFEAAVASDGDDVAARRRLGMLHLDAGRFAAAREHLGVAERVDPATLSTRKAAGLAAMWTGDLDEAVRLLGDLPGITDELNTWSYWRRSRDETALAVHAIRVSLAIDPSQPAVREALAALDPAAASAAPQR
jgi:O-antigen ligase